MAHTRQSRPDSGFAFQVKTLKDFAVVFSSYHERAHSDVASVACSPLSIDWDDTASERRGDTASVRSEDTSKGVKASNHERAHSDVAVVAREVLEHRAPLSDARIRQGKLPWFTITGMARFAQSNTS